ncbi:hypothetical protein ZWY2020_003185 [Hordeum vulgare]|nr:hypothetical protein ZWY2020_003185 [Hordeum vulgare]
MLLATDAADHRPGHRRVGGRFWALEDGDEAGDNDVNQPAVTSPTPSNLICESIQTTDRSDRLDRCPEVESPNCAPVPRYWFISLLFRDPYFLGVCVIIALALGDGSSLSRWTASILSINDDEDHDAETGGDSGSVWSAADLIFIYGLAKVRLLPNRELTLEYLCLSGVGVVSTWLQLLTESTEEASSSDSLGLPADLFPLRSGHLSRTLRCLAALCMEFSLLIPGPRVTSSALLPTLENEVARSLFH